MFCADQFRRFVLVGEIRESQLCCIKKIKTPVIEFSAPFLPQADSPDLIADRHSAYHDYPS